MHYKNIALPLLITLSPITAFASDWEKIAGSASAQPFYVDMSSIRDNPQQKTQKHFIGKFNLTIATPQGSTEGSIIGNFTLDCTKKAIRAEGAKVYDQFDGQGELLGEEPADDSFAPLNDAIRAKDLLGKVCRINI